MNNFLRKMGLATVCVLSFGAGSQAEAAGSPVKSSDGVVQLNGGNALFNSQEPLQTLATELKRNRNDRRFRIIWHFGSGVVGAGMGTYTALYKRDGSTLKIFGKHVDKTGTYYSNYLYIQVQDDTLLQLAEKYKTGKSGNGDYDNDELAYFLRVSEFGAKSQVVPTGTSAKTKR